MKEFEEDYYLSLAYELAGLTRKIFDTPKNLGQRI